MSKKKIKILSTLGPSTFNKKFLNFAKGKISLLRLNTSHIELNELENIIRYLRKNSNIPICLDTEGAQIRTKVKNVVYYKKNKKIKINFKNGNFNLYPDNVFKKLKKKDELIIGFNNFRIKISGISKNYLLAKTITEGLLEDNKGVHLNNRSIKLNYLTEKDFQAIKIAKKFKVKNYALSFTSSVDDMEKFKNIFKKELKIYKIETKKAIKNIKDIIKNGDNFLIDRGDLSIQTSVEQIPRIQRIIFEIANKNKNKKVYVATNLLESMILNKYPSRGEANDIYNSLEMGAAGLVLAAETAIGKYPYETLIFLKKMISDFQKK